DQAGRDDVAWKGSIRRAAERIHYYQWLPSVGHNLREIAGVLRRRGNIAQGAGTVRIPQALPTEHEEGAVVTVVQLWNAERPLNPPTPLVLMEGKPIAVEVGLGVEKVIAQILKQRAVPVVSPGLQNHVQDAARHFAVLR